MQTLDLEACARAVLTAVREPDADVCFVGDQLVGDHGSNGQGVFTAMIDAILNEKDTTND